MTVVLVVRAADGTKIGQCAKHCYDAHPDSKCRCICGGENHGKGRARALHVALETAARWSRCEVAPEAKQIQIPGTIENLDE